MGDGAWGLRWTGLEPPPDVLMEGDASWPVASVQVDVHPRPPADTLWGRDRARLPLVGGNHIDVGRDPLAVRLTLQQPTPTECVVQPHLAAAASTIALWHGRLPLHAGAFAVDGAAWILLGDKGAGKSSTLGWLAREGWPVLTDDLVIWEAGRVLAGPRCVDLRAGPAAVLGLGRNLGVIGTRERWRVDLPACPVALPVGGWLFLQWGDAARVEGVPVKQRVTRLAEHRAITVPWTDPAAVLDMISLPCLSWHRPPGWGGFAQTVEQLLHRLMEETTKRSPDRL